MKIVIAPDSFKESLAAAEVCDAIADGLLSVRRDIAIDKCPMADGGEGTVQALVAATGGTLLAAVVSGPLGEPASAAWGVLGDGSGTAVLETAAASGLALVPPARRNPLKTSTFGTGCLIREALDRGIRRILLGIGGSATNDGGAGCAQALGVQFLDADGRVLADPMNGESLAHVARIDVSQLDPRIARIDLLVACDVDNPLCGSRGAAAVYGPQKGATPDIVRELDANLAHFSDVIERDLSSDIRHFPGAGAAGGLGAGLVAFLNAKIQPGVRIVIDAVRLKDRLLGADLLITGEGRLDRQSMMGKVIQGVGRAGKAAKVPVVALVGSIGEGADAAREVLDDYHCITPPGTPLPEALARASEFLRASAASLLRDRTPRT
jgi:glycerate kinase